MPEIDVDSDLEQITKQIEDLVAQLNSVNVQKNQLEQSIHNLNGIAMYLRGKQQEEPVESVEDFKRSEGYPEEILTE
tara:strand:- start:248 stop:478 length:231 start_codon:yes stop_codon:yes gene_type:complete